MGRAGNGVDFSGEMCYNEIGTYTGGGAIWISSKEQGS